MTLTLNSIIDLLSAALALDKSDVRKLPVIAAYPSFYVVASFELSPVRAIVQKKRIIRIRRVDRVLAFAASLPRAQRRIVIEAKVFNFAIEQFGQHCQLFSEQNTEAAARDECLDPFHVGIAWSWPISLDHGVDKHFAELPESNPAFHFD